MCDCYLIKENKRLTEELIKAKEYIIELEIKVKKIKEKENKEDLEKLFDPTDFDFDLE